MAQTTTVSLRATLAIDPQKLREGFGVAGSSNAPRIRVSNDWGDGVGSSGHTLVIEGGTANPFTAMISGHLLLPRGATLYMITNDATAWPVTTGDQSLQLRSLDEGTAAALSADILLLGLERGI